MCAPLLLSTDLPVYHPHEAGVSWVSLVRSELPFPRLFKATAVFLLNSNLSSVTFLWRR